MPVYDIFVNAQDRDLGGISDDVEKILNQLRQHPDLVSVRVRDLSAMRTPDSIPSLQRVIQHVSWAPVIVDLDWKTLPALGR